MSTVNDLLNILSFKEKNNDNDNDKDDLEDKEKSKVVIKRYFPGKIPEYAKGVKEDEDDEDDEDEEEEEEEEQNNESEEQNNENEEQNIENQLNQECVYIRDIKTEKKNNIIKLTNLNNLSKKNLEFENERYKIYEEQKNNNIPYNKEERLKRRFREIVFLKKEETEEKEKEKEKERTYNKVVDIFIKEEPTEDNIRKEKTNEKNKKIKKKEAIEKKTNKDEKDDNKEEEDEEEDEEEEEEEEEDEDDDEDEEDKSEDEDSYMSDEEEDSYMNDEEKEKNISLDGGKGFKPNFVFKNSRQTIMKEKEELDKLQMLNIEKEKQLIEQTQRENVIKETLQRELMEEELKQKSNNIYSSEEEFEEEEYDEETKQKEYELWKIREINRLKRDTLEREKFVILKHEIKKRRKMTDREILEDNKNLPNKQKHKKKKMLFLQKYYHRGGFYQDLFEKGKEEIYTRDYNEPVYEDKIDKTKLPKVLRVRRGVFGKQGRTKYTHLLDNDTSVKDSLWKEGEIKPNSKKKTDLLDRPTNRKK